MPTYNYECNACGHAFELFQSMTARVKRKCPECGRPKLQRLIGTGAGIIFKGSGFYQTDYRSASYQAGAKSAEGGDAAPTTTAAKNESAPADPKPGSSKPGEAKSAQAKSPAAQPGKSGSGGTSTG